jgi:hypothetical protein
MKSVFLKGWRLGGGGATQYLNIYNTFCDIS